MKKVFFYFLLCSSIVSQAQVLNYQTGSTVPDFTVTDLSGQTHSLYNYTAQGKYVVLDFFAYWCTTCAANAPIIDNFYRTYGCNGGDVVVIGIELEGSNAQALTFEANAGLPENSFPVASGIEGGGAAVHSSWGVSAFPTIVAISPGNAMLNNDIWPLSEGTAIYAAIQDSTVTAMECTATVVDERPQPENTLRCLCSDRHIVLQGQVDIDLGAAQLLLHDMTGKMIASISLGQLPQGKYFRSMEIEPIAPGVYVAAIQAHGHNIQLAPFWVY